MTSSKLFLVGVRTFLLSLSVPWVFGQVELTEVGPMPGGVQESSGLIFDQGTLYTHNDSGGAAELYQLDPDTGDLLRTIRVENATHVDWEDLAGDADYIFIGDFGNNLGSRTDLRIYRVPREQLREGTTVNAESIDFSLAGQQEFEPREIHPFDMEAFFAMGDSLYILTKDRENQVTTAYRLSKTPGVQQAEVIGNVDVQGLVTGADYDPAGDRLLILGYTSLLQPFLYQVNDASRNGLFDGPQSRSGISMGFAQSEGIVFETGNTFYISTERFESNLVGQTPALLYRGSADLIGEDEPLPDDDPGPGEPPEAEEDELRLYRPPSSLGFLHFRLITEQAVLGRGIYSSNGVRVRFTPPETLDEQPIPIGDLAPGVYFIAYYLRNDVLVKAFHVP